jgi:hypothetical protein
MVKEDSGLLFVFVFELMEDAELVIIKAVYIYIGEWRILRHI